MKDKQVDKKKIKNRLMARLIKERAFWSYDQAALDVSGFSDDTIIAYTMRYLDVDEIGDLFKIYPYNKIKSAWRRLLVPEGEYLYTLNRFFAWYYFGAKKPDSYLKSLQTRHFNSLFNS